MFTTDGNLEQFDRSWHRHQIFFILFFNPGALQVGREEPAMSMDTNGKIIWAKHSEIQQANLKAMGDAEIKDGERLPLAVKDMGSCEIYPQTIQHNPNGRSDPLFQTINGLEVIFMIMSLLLICIHLCSTGLLWYAGMESISSTLQWPSEIRALALHRSLSGHMTHLSKYQFQSKRYLHNLEV